MTPSSRSRPFRTCATTSTSRTRSSRCTTAVRRRPLHPPAAARPLPPHPRRPLRNPELSSRVARLTGITVSPAASLAAWVETYGGTIDDGARGSAIARVAPLEDAHSGDLCPFTLRPHPDPAIRSAPRRAAPSLDTPLAALVPEGKRW